MTTHASQRGKIAAAHHAAGLVQEGMAVGLGSGSTAELFVRALGERVRAGLRIVGVPTSAATEMLARAEGIALTTLEERSRLDMDVDGADAVDPALNMVKGLGGALLREKIVAAASDQFIAVVDESKLVDDLGAAPVVPVEVVTFGWSRTRDELERLGAVVSRRARRGAGGQASGEPFTTDGGNFVLDCRFADLSDPASLAERIKMLTGVVDHGLFIGIASKAVAGSGDGTVRVLAAR